MKIQLICDVGLGNLKADDVLLALIIVILVIGVILKVIKPIDKARTLIY